MSEHAMERSEATEDLRARRARAGGSGAAGPPLEDRAKRGPDDVRRGADQRALSGWSRVAAPWIAGIAVAVLAGTSAAKPNQPGVTVTIYRSTPAATPGAPQNAAVDPGGFALVTERRVVSLTAGLNDVRFGGVAAHIDPATVHFADLTDPGTTVAEQTFRHDLASVDRLLARYVGQKITVVTDQGERQGVLRSFDPAQLVLDTGDAAAPLYVVERGTGIQNLRLPALPGGIVAEPTLIWKLDAKKGGDHLAEVTYQTPGMSWSADYTVVVAADQKQIELQGWLTVVNQSGVDLRDATVRLVSGDVHRATLDAQGPYGDYYRPQVVAAAAAPLREYTLPRRATLADGAAQQLVLVPPMVAPTGARVYLAEHRPRGAGIWQQQGYPYFDQGADGYNNAVNGVDLVLEVENSARNGLGQPLPPGRLRIYRRDDGGGLALVSEETLQHTPTDGGVRVRLGATREITGERKQIEWRYDDPRREMREKFEIKLRNTTKAPVEVVVVETLYRWRFWRVEDENTPYTPLDDGQRVQFRVKIPANGETSLIYTAVYHTWS